MAQSITARLQTPEDSDGNRTDVNLITRAEAVIVNADSEEDAMPLDEYLDNIGSSIVISKTQPEQACIWAKPITN